MPPRMRHADVDDATNVLAGKVVDSAFRIRRHIGIGLLESVYQEALRVDLTSMGLRANREVPVFARIDGRRLELVFKADLIVEDAILVEVKAVKALRPEHTAQLLTYLSMTRCKVGLLVNFNEPMLRQGIRRRVWTGPRHVADDE